MLCLVPWWPLSGGALSAVHTQCNCLVSGRTRHPYFIAGIIAVLPSGQYNQEWVNIVPAIWLLCSRLQFSVTRKSSAHCTRQRFPRIVSVHSCLLTMAIERYGDSCIPLYYHWANREHPRLPSAPVEAEVC